MNDHNYLIPLSLPVTMLLVACLPLPYVYYEILKLVICGYSLYIVNARLKKKEFKLTFFTFLIIALIYNPIWAPDFEKDFWIAANLLAATAYSIIWLIDAKGRRNEAYGAMKILYFDFMMIVFFAGCISAFSLYVYWGFALKDYMDDEFNNEFLSYIATLAYVLVVIIGIPIAWESSEGYRKIVFRKSNTDNQ